MNKLSWLLYWANVSENIGTLLGIISFAFFFVAVAYWIVYFYNRNEWSYNLRYYRDDNEKPKPPSNLTAILVSPIFLVFATAAAFCPSKSTVYAIAASQMGEQVFIHTPLAAKAEQALDAWLDRQIAAKPKTDAE